ncbi:MAG: hypothetical protein AAF297_10555 [Planctomycetota bacterium]
MPVSDPVSSSMLTLAQGLAQEFLSKPDIRPLPEPGVVEQYLFGGSVLLWGALLAAGLVALVGLATRGKAKQGVLIGGGFFVVAIAAWALAQFVTTEREALMDRVSGLVATTAAANADGLGPYLDEEIRLSIRGFGVDMPRDRILSLVRTQLGGAYRIESHTVLERQAVIDGPGTARTQVSVRVDGPSFGRVGSWWAIDWQDRGDGWRAVSIEALYIPGVVSEPN